MSGSCLLALLPLLACRPEPSHAETTPPRPTPGALAEARPVETSEPEPEESVDDTAATDPDALPPLPTGIAAEVGSVQIPMTAFHEIYDLKVVAYTERGRKIPRSADARYRRSIAERLVHHELLRQEAQRLGVAHDPAEVAAREALVKRSVEDWELHLRRRGETEASLREMYIAELLEEAILDKLGKLAVSRKEIAAEYAKVKEDWRSDRPRVRASHILVPFVPPDAPQPVDDAAEKAYHADAEAKALRIHALAKHKGADFAALAREHSTGPSASIGGDIGIFTADRMVEEFSKVAFGLKVGQISKPVKTKFGWHIIKVTGRWPPGLLPLEALRDSITDRLRQRKLHEGRRALKDDLRAKTPIVDHVSATAPLRVR